MMPVRRDAYPSNTLTRPLARGFVGTVASGHALATQAAIEVLRDGGNAVDAGVAAGLCLNVVHPDKTAFGGIAPILVARPDGSRCCITGVGPWPVATAVDAVRAADALGPAGALARATVPAAADAWCTALERFGTISFERAVRDAHRYARDGAPVNDYLAFGIARAVAMPGMWPETLALIAPDGKPLRAGERLVQPALARTFERMVDAERSTCGDRAAGVRSARDVIYQGDLAEILADAVRRAGGTLQTTDLERYSAQVEAPIELDAFGVRVATTGPWSQGLVLLQALGILEHHDLGALGLGTDAYLHTIAAALELAFADRERYLGDPDHVDVPLAALLDRGYLAERARAIGSRAFGSPPMAGAIVGGHAERFQAEHEPRLIGPDTSYVAVADAAGGLFSATPSDTVLDTAFVPAVAALGYGPSGRGNQSRRSPTHPAALGPGRRPRVTPMPTLVTWPDGRAMAIGTPGGDAQPQTILQVLLAIIVFGVDPQGAVEWPRVVTDNHHGSFAPFTVRPGVLRLEGGVADRVSAGLHERGYQLERGPLRSGSVCLAGRLDAGRSLVAAADHRLEALALGT